LPAYSAPYTTQAALAYGIQQTDSALAYGVDSVRFLNLARVVKGRALLDLGDWDAAAAAVQSVPTSFVYQTFSDQYNPFFTQYYDGYWGPVGDREGGTGLPFVSAHDPRVPTVYVMQRTQNPADSLFDQQKYTSVFAPIALASGVEARLIEAEALLHDDPTGVAWFAALNQLRKTAISPAMDTLTVVPASMDAKVDLLYTERAFWLYLTGRRLGDLRRLVRLYDRDPSTLYPQGAYWFGGRYGVSTAIPFILAANRQFNPKITTGCGTD